jgi:hypothetical protein
MPFLMQARSSVTGEIVTWVSEFADWEGGDFPGPGTPSQIAATPPGPGGDDDPNILYRGAHDALVLTESVVRLLTGTAGTFNRTKADTIAIGETVKRVCNNRRTNADTCSVTDSIARVIL